MLDHTFPSKRIKYFLDEEDQSNSTGERFALPLLALKVEKSRHKPRNMATSTKQEQLSNYTSQENEDYDPLATGE
jgi:hypothetical protein